MDTRTPPEEFAGRLFKTFFTNGRMGYDNPGGARAVIAELDRLRSPDIGYLLDVATDQENKANSQTAQLLAQTVPGGATLRLISFAIAASIPGWLILPILLNELNQDRRRREITAAFGAKPERGIIVIGLARLARTWDRREGVTDGVRHGDAMHSAFRLALYEGKKIGVEDFIERVTEIVQTHPSTDLREFFASMWHTNLAIGMGRPENMRRALEHGLQFRSPARRDNLRNMVEAARPHAELQAVITEFVTKHGREL